MIARENTKILEVSLIGLSLAFITFLVIQKNRKKQKVHRGLQNIIIIIIYNILLLFLG